MNPFRQIFTFIFTIHSVLLTGSFSQQRSQQPSSEPLEHEILTQNIIIEELQNEIKQLEGSAQQRKCESTQYIEPNASKILQLENNYALLQKQNNDLQQKLGQLSKEIHQIGAANENFQTQIDCASSTQVMNLAFITSQKALIAENEQLKMQIQYLTRQQYQPGVHYPLSPGYPKLNPFP